MKKADLLKILIFFTGYLPLAYGADTGGGVHAGLVTQELARTRAELAQDPIAPQQKHSALRRLASLLELAGYTDTAATVWQQAAFAEDGLRDNDALLKSAACYISIGEWDKAAAAIHTVLLTVRDDRSVYLWARYLSAQIEAFHGGNEVVLLALIEDPDFSQMRPALYWALWKLSGKIEYSSRLAANYPQSPETKLYLAETGTKNGVFEAASPLWILPAVELTLEPAAVTAVAEPTRDESTEPPPLQTGVFNQKKNAEQQAARLKRAGFIAEVVRKVTGSSEYWSVIVPSGVNMQRTLVLLKEAGFDAFPVYSN